MKIMEIKEKEFQDKVLNAKEKILIDFKAEWCGPCKMMSSVIDSLEDDLTSYTIYKVDVDECPNIAREYGVMSIPTLMIFDQGKVLKSEVGFKTKDELEEFLKP